MGCEIVPATLRDVSYIASNMNADDWRECEAQMPEGMLRAAIAAMSLQVSPYAWVALWRGQPVAAFGAAQAPLRAWHWSAWMFGTDNSARAVPAITRHIKRVLIPALLDEGANRVEAISHVSHETAHGWLKSLGARQRCELPGYGRNNETYLLFEWTRNDVLFQAAQAAASSQNS